MDDQEAIELCRRKQPEGYRVLFDRYGPFLLTLAMRFLGDMSLAEDAVQETFAAAFRNLDNFRGESRFKTWLYTILYRTALRLRKQCQREMLVDELPMSEIDVHGHAKSVETRLSVKEILDRLPERDRALLLMSYWDDLSCAEISEVMGITVNHVKVLLFRARERFARLWSEKPHEKGKTEEMV